MANNEVTINRSSLFFKRFITNFVVSALGQFLFIFASFLDSMIAGNLLDVDALNAIQVITPINTLMYFVCNLCSSGVTARYFYILNKGEKERAHRLAFTSIVATIIIGILTATLFFFIRDPFINLFPLNEATREYARNYYFWFIIMAIFFPTYLLIAEFVAKDCDNAIKVSSDISQCVIKIVLSFILVRYLSTFGLGLATFISFACALLIVCAHFFRKKNSIKLCFSFNFNDLGVGIKLSIGYAFAFLCCSIITFVQNVFVSKFFGAQYLPVVTIINFMLTLCGVVRRISNSISPLVTMAYSSKNKNDYDYLIKLVNKFTNIFTPIFSLVVIALFPCILMLYNIKPDSGIYWYCVVALISLASIYIASVHLRNICNIYVCMQKTSIFIIYDLLTIFFNVPISLLFALPFGLNGMSISFALTYVVDLLIIGLLLFIQNKPHKLYKDFDVDEDQYSVDIVLNKENIKTSISLFKEFLDKYDINEELKNDILCELEEVYESVMKFNPNKKVIDRVTVCIGKSEIRLLNKNNGRLIPDEEKQKEIKNTKNHPHFTTLYEERSDFSIFGSSTFNCGYLSVPLR